MLDAKIVTDLPLTLDLWNDRILIRLRGDGNEALVCHKNVAGRVWVFGHLTNATCNRLFDLALRIALDAPTTWPRSLEEHEAEYNRMIAAS